MQIWKFINMEPPSAAIPFKMLSSLALFVFICILERSSSLGETKTHTGAKALPHFLCLPWKIDHVQIMGLSVCTIYCPPSTRFLYKKFSHVFLSARCCKLHERKSICIQKRKEFFIIWQRQRLMKYCQYLCETCIIFFIAALTANTFCHFSSLEVSNFAGGEEQQFSLTIIGFKAAAWCFWGANRLTICVVSVPHNNSTFDADLKSLNRIKTDIKSVTFCDYIYWTCFSVSSTVWDFFVIYWTQ